MYPVPSYIISKLARKLSSNHRESSEYQICSPAASSRVGEYPWFCSTLLSTSAAFTTICHYKNTHQMGMFSSNYLHLYTFLKNIKLCSLFSYISNSDRFINKELRYIWDLVGTFRFTKATIVKDRQVPYNREI